MERLEAKATTTEVREELGTFTALVSGWSRDRQDDEILPSAFDKTIASWKRSGRQLPLLFEHSTKAVGTIFPELMRTNSEGLVAAGEVDRSTDEGKQVWRQVKAGTISFSIGFMVTKSKPREGGKGRLIGEVDLLEVSATSTPMHPSARALSWKSAANDTLRRESLALAREARAAVAASDYAELRRESKTLARETLLSVGPLSRKSEDELVPPELVGTSVDPFVVDAPVSELVAQWPKALEEHKAAERAEARREAQQRAVSIPTRIEFDGTRYIEIDARDPGDISPGFRWTGAPLPTANEIKRANERAERQQREEREQKEAQRREAAAVREAERRFRETATINVNGHQVKPCNVRVNGQ
jgi:HK97 family phage prohead protease